MRKWSRANAETIRQRVRRYREENLELVRARDRARGWRKPPADRYRAHLAVTQAIKRGELVREPCEVCGKEPTDAHHDDYGRLLDVRWLCSVHHGMEHRAVEAAV
jgi:hypothetical protein